MGLSQYIGDENMDILAKKHRNRREQGNVMVYILIALALFGFLTMTLARQNVQSDGQNLNDENAILYTNELIEYVASAQAATDRMLMTVSTPDDLDFILPSNAAFDTSPNIHKVFHPTGGGLNYQSSFSEAIRNDATSGWYFQNNINVEWTPTTANDILLTAYFIPREVCAALNKKLIGDATIPVTANSHDDYFLLTGTTDFDTTECAACEGIPSMCVENDTNDNYSFYTIIEGQ